LFAKSIHPKQTALRTAALPGKSLLSIAVPQYRDNHHREQASCQQRGGNVSLQSVYANPTNKISCKLFLIHLFQQDLSQDHAEWLAANGIAFTAERGREDMRDGKSKRLRPALFEWEKSS